MSLRRAIPTKPNTPEPRSTIEPGSGTVDGVDSLIVHVPGAYWLNPCLAKRTGGKGGSCPKSTNPPDPLYVTISVPIAVPTRPTYREVIAPVASVPTAKTELEKIVLV